MGEYQEIFKRYEKKYMLDDRKYRRLMEILNRHMELDDYGKHTICNVYFDTPDYRLVRESIEKPVYKEKLRLRSYGVPGGQDVVFAELKKKYDGVVYKRRIPLSLTEAEDYLMKKKPVAQPSQISREIDWFMDFYHPVPSAFIAYDRIALFGKENSEFRVTFDENIRWRSDQLSLASGDWGQPQLERGQHLMEIKIPNAMPIWMAEALNSLDIYSISYSKYGTCYQKHLYKSLYVEGGAFCA